MEIYGTYILENEGLFQIIFLFKGGDFQVPC